MTSFYTLPGVSARSFLESQEKTLRSCPLIVGTLTGRLPLDSQIAKASPADLIEVRLDTFAGSYGSTASACQFARELLTDVKRKSRQPLLVTFRAPGERGTPVHEREKISLEERGRVLEAAIPLAAVVDLEIRHLHWAERLTLVARRHRVDALHSYHAFHGPLHLSLLSRIARLSRRAGGKFFKVAVTPRSETELHAFLKWGLQLPGLRPVLVAMGTTGLPSRFIGFSFGSVLTFGHLGKSAAPGQVPVSQLARSIRNIYGKGVRS